MQERPVMSRSSQVGKQAAAARAQACKRHTEQNSSVMQEKPDHPRSVIQPNNTQIMLVLLQFVVILPLLQSGFSMIWSLKRHISTYSKLRVLRAFAHNAEASIVPQANHRNPTTIKSHRHNIARFKQYLALQSNKTTRTSGGLSTPSGPAPNFAQVSHLCWIYVLNLILTNLSPCKSIFATLLQTSYFRLAEATILQHSFQADTGKLYDVLALDWRPTFLWTSMQYVE